MYAGQRVLLVVLISLLDRLQLSQASLVKRRSVRVNTESFLHSRASGPEVVEEPASLDADSRIIGELEVSINKEPQADEVAVQSSTSGPSVFVAIFSSKQNWWRRHTLRKALVHGAAAAPGFFTAKFAICAKDQLPKALDLEAKKFGDMLFLECEEGLARTLLTRKFLATVQEYNNSFADRFTHVMRVDDDTFVSWGRLQRIVTGAKVGDLSYMGFAMAAGRPVNRDKNSPWYQPEESFPGKVYPQYMVKGQGYLLSRALVDIILREDVASANMLSNEDQAVGVWVEEVRQNGIKVDVVEIPGTEGRLENSNQTWSKYPFVLHHMLKGDTIRCLAEAEAKGDPDRQIGDCFHDSMFVAVFSARRNVEKRRHLRNTTPLAEGLFKHTKMKFVLCDDPDLQDEMKDILVAEMDEFDDIMLLDCEEGYARTLLTKKLIATMRAYVKNYGERSLFMKVDDDTFVSWNKLRKIISEQARPERVYMGVMGPAGVKVNRDVNSLWYQPADVYPDETYPQVMEGGPGYILGSELVRRILASGITKDRLLSNEDQAMGVWVDSVKKAGTPVNVVVIPGTDGYRPEFDACYGRWEDYPFYLHHNLKPETISCLAQLEQARDGSRTIDACFPDCIKLTATALNAKIGEVSSEVQSTMGKLRSLEGELEGIMKGFQWMTAQVGNLSVS